MSVVRAEGIGKHYTIGQGTTRRTIREVFNRTTSKAGDRSFWALRGVSFDVKEGEVVGIIGRNGAGKSTLLKLLSRITLPTEGRAEILGRVGSLLEVGTGFHPELTGRENIFLNGAILGMGKRETRGKFDEIVAFSEIERFIDTPVKRYSSGMYVRLAFAVAAHLEPDVLLVDEVLAVGDGEFQRKCLGKIEEVSQEQRTVIFVSHQISSIEQLCQRVVLLSAGEVRAFGPTQEVVASYLNDATVSTDGEFDLAGHPTRSAAYDPIFRRLSFLSDTGELVTSYAPDDAMVVELLIESSEPLRDPRIALAISDNQTRRIATVASFLQEEQLPGIAGPTRIRCSIPRLNLGSGRYNVSLSISDRYQGFLDVLDDVASFDVVWQNNYANGEPYRTVYGPMLLPSTWARVE